MPVIEILLVILILAASAFFIFAIFYLKRITEQFEAIQKDIHGFMEKTGPVVENLKETTKSIKRIVFEVESYWNEMDNYIDNVRQCVLNFTSLKSIRNVGYPAINLLKNINAAAKGIAVFWNEYRK